MLLRLENPKIFSDIIGIISELVLEVRLKVSKEGMSIIAIDPANVAMVSFYLPVSSISELNVEKEEVLGLSLENLKAVLRRVKTGSVLVMSTNENELRLQIHDKIKREFNLALIEIESEEKKLPNLEFTSMIEMSSNDFSEAIEDCKVVADACTFNSEADKFVILGKGPLNSFKTEFSSDEISITSQKANAKYSLEYLQKMIKATKLTERVKINFSDEYPLKLEFSDDTFRLDFVLAPRVETED